MREHHEPHIYAANQSTCVATLLEGSSQMLLAAPRFEAFAALPCVCRPEGNIFTGPVGFTSNILKQCFKGFRLNGCFDLRCRGPGHRNPRDVRREVNSSTAGDRRLRELCTVVHTFGKVSLGIRHKLEEAYVLPVVCLVDSLLVRHHV